MYHVTDLRLGIKYGRSFLRQLCLRACLLHLNAIGIPSRSQPSIRSFNIFPVHSLSFSDLSHHNDLQKLPHNNAVPIYPAASDPDGFSMCAPAASGSQPIPVI
jgi:hypothetical protein